MPYETANERVSAAGPRGTVCLRSVVRPLAGLIGVAIILWGIAPPALGQTATLPELPRLFHDAGPEGWALNAENATAYEENGHFTFVICVVEGEDDGGQVSGDAGKSARLVRRFFFLEPSIFVIDDQLFRRGSETPAKWLLRSVGKPEMVDGTVRVVDGGGTTLCQTVLPVGAKIRIEPASGTQGQPEEASFVSQVVPGSGSAEVRFLHVFFRQSSDDESTARRVRAVDKAGVLELRITGGDREFQLSLPEGFAVAGEIAVSRAGGETLLARRILPAGIMPHGPEGVAMLERWDSAYRRDGRPGWDTGRVSSNLQKVVEAGTIAPCRAVVLGCGTGTNAIFLSKRGFDVTGIDVAPTALKLAEEKAEKAGVKVRWLLADVTAPPELERFDFVFDRGCYHGVRRQNAAGYVRSLVGLARPGARVLILAGNANEERHYGPPRVKEGEIRGDFSEQFDFQWLRESNFDTKTPGDKGALAWSIMLRKKE